MRIAVLAFAAGVICLQFQPVLPTWAAWCWLGVLPWLLPWRGSGWRVVLVCLGCFSLGFGYASWRAELRLADALAAEWEGQDVELVGVVASLPQAFSQGSRYEFAVETVLTAKAQVPTRVLLSFYQGQQDAEVSPPMLVKPGERWRLTVRLKRPHGNANPGGFDYEAWLLERGVRATGYVRANPPQRLDAFVWAPDYAIERLRFLIRDNFQGLLPASDWPLAGVLLALTIGDQKAVGTDLWTLFNRTGTTHLMSISGLHVTMVAALFGWLVTALWRRTPRLAEWRPAQQAGVLAACGAALGYALLAGFAVPAQRTLYMLLVAALAVLSGRLFAPSRTLALALLLVLLVDPWAVLAAGFWLSFLAVAALLYITSGEVGELPGWRGWWRAWGRTQWAATLASLPVLLLIFQQFSLVSPLANALAIPVISFIVTPLALLAALLPWWPIAALAHTVLAWLMVFLGWCSSWPLWQAPAAPWWAMAAALLGVALCLLPRGVPGRIFGGFLIVPVLFWPVSKPPEGSAWIAVLDVGQGLASVVRTREHVLIYDPGPIYGGDADAGQRVVVPYLRWLGINRVDRMIVTHRDSDHSGGTASVLAALPVGEVLSSVPEIAGRPCVAGDAWQWDGVDFAILHPLPGAFTVNGKSNHVSCVLRVTAGGRTMLLTSDIEAPDESALLQRAAGDLRADVLLVPHHGSRTSSTPAFLAVVGAQAAVIPVGYRNRFGHPKEDVLARYEALGLRPWRTDRDGAVLVQLGEGGVAISAWRDLRHRYWHGR